MFFYYRILKTNAIICLPLCVFSALRRSCGTIIRQHVFNGSVPTESCFQFSVHVTYGAHNILKFLGRSIPCFY